MIYIHGIELGHDGGNPHAEAIPSIIERPEDEGEKDGGTADGRIKQPSDRMKNGASGFFA